MKKDEVAPGSPEMKPDPIPADKKRAIDKTVEEAKRFLSKVEDVTITQQPGHKAPSKAEWKRLFMACKRASQDLESELKSLRRVL